MTYGNPFVIEEAEVSLTVADQNGDKVWLGGCARGITLSDELTENIQQFHGRNFGTARHVDEGHTIEIENVWLLETGGLQMPMLGRNQVLCLVIVWLDEETQFFHKRTYYGVTGRSQRISTPMQNVTWRAERFVPLSGNDPPDSLPTPDAMVFYVEGGNSVPFYYYDPATRAFSATRELDLALAEIRYSSNKCEIFLGGQVAALADATGFWVKRIASAGNPRQSNSPRLEFRWEGRIIASLSAESWLSTGNAFEVLRFSPPSFTQGAIKVAGSVQDGIYEPQEDGGFLLYGETAVVPASFAITGNRVEGWGIYGADDTNLYYSAETVDGPELVVNWRNGSDDTPAPGIKVTRATKEDIDYGFHLRNSGGVIYGLLAEVGIFARNIWETLGLESSVYYVDGDTRVRLYNYNRLSQAFAASPDLDTALGQIEVAPSLASVLVNGATALQVQADHTLVVAGFEEVEILSGPRLDFLFLGDWVGSLNADGILAVPAIHETLDDYEVEAGLGIQLGANGDAILARSGLYARALSENTAFV